MRSIQLGTDRRTRSDGGRDIATITVTYTDDSAINPATIDSGDIGVAPARKGSGNDLTISNVNKVVSGDNKTATVTYTILGPGGGWDTADNGNYTVTV